MKTNRRETLGLMLAAGGVASAPGMARALELDPVYDSFERARLTQPWTLGMVDAPAEGLNGTAELFHGALPEGLSGVLHRNGPGRFSRNDWRYRHWFDGDGMVHRWEISDQGVTHRARFVQTNKWRMEEEAGRFLMPALGSVPPDMAGIRGPDDMNVANTSVIRIGDELLALWEGGSAWSLDPETLATHGVKNWSPELSSMPFSAHPSRDVDGTIWNFGADPFREQLVLWRIDPDGSLRKADLVRDVPGGMIHDFVITDRSLVFLIGCDRMGEMQLPIIAGYKWQDNIPMRAVVFDKEDWSVRRDFDLPPGFLFHFGGAWEEADGTIRLQAAIADNADFAYDGAFRAMRGEAGSMDPDQSRMRHVTLRPGGRVDIETHEDLFAEFPQIDARFIGQQHRHTWHIGQHRHTPDETSNIVRRDGSDGPGDAYDYGAGRNVEEALFVPREGSTREGDGWLVQTVLNTAEAVTELHVLDAMNLSAGPVASWRLPYSVPLGFHGTWTNA
ncbi:MAG: carotenoid oxygenase family protein [Maricaulis sp.]|jgi:all-trans-8'-apo-beta-carotenal 15,15'-oxygenase|nr:carotenoid oxygenase family protein [Maricaulis sp.]MDG2045322.1 carotenoid oxygenase family protein [Maricaulis sp.]